MIEGGDRRVDAVPGVDSDDVPDLLGGAPDSVTSMSDQW
jgi:hypothetical protein